MGEGHCQKESFQNNNRCEKLFENHYWEINLGCKLLFHWFRSRLNQKEKKAPESCSKKFYEIYFINRTKEKLSLNIENGKKSTSEVSMKDNKLIDNEEDIEQKFGCTYETKII